MCTFLFRNTFFLGNNGVATHVHTSAMGVGLTSLGLWDIPGQDRKDLTATTSLATPPIRLRLHTLFGTAGCRPPTVEDCWPSGGATEELLTTTLLGSLARGHKADYSRAAWVQRYPALPAADQTGNAGHRAEPRRSCSATTPSLHVCSRPRRGN